MERILTIDDLNDLKFLRTPTKAFDFATHSKEEVRDLVKRMRKRLAETHDGVGLSANQVGLSDRLFIVNYDGKFYSVFNPEIVKMSAEIEDGEEGCLSVPNTYLNVPRAKRITLLGYGQNGKRIKVNASDVLARIFQHETDHLDGILFIDRAK